MEVKEYQNLFSQELLFDLLMVNCNLSDMKYTDFWIV